MALTYIAGLFGLITTILWLVIGWRAMKAHEEIAESIRWLRSDVSKLADSLGQKDKPSNLPKLRD